MPGRFSRILHTLGLGLMGLASLVMLYVGYITCPVESDSAWVFAAIGLAVAAYSGARLFFCLRAYKGGADSWGGRLLRWLEVCGSGPVLLCALLPLWILYAVNPASVDASMIGTLGSLRSSVSIYASDAEDFPKDLQALVPKYASSIPMLWRAPRGTALHPMSNAVEYYPTLTGKDTGHWAYVNDPASPDFGKVYIDCTHTDHKGRVWSAY
ncbi:MAG: hypothetical protein WC728_02990 [Elusimicrobiota bacterium]